MTVPAPEWFTRALSVPFEDGTVDVAGCPIHYVTWGDAGAPGLVFVHGGGAHAHWWTHIAAQFADEFRVMAIDLSGHGDSGRRGVYALEVWTDEVVAATRAAGIVAPPVIVGHSMGGFVSIATAARHSDAVRAVVICDSPVSEPDPEIGAFKLKEAFGVPRVYPTIDDALRRFRTVPPQDHYLDYVVDHVARKSLQPVDGGYRWKFDHQIFMQFGEGMRQLAMPYLPGVRCPFVLLRSECGLVTEDIKRTMHSGLGRHTPIVEIAEAGHHAMLDQPLLLLTALRTLLAVGF